MAITNANVRGQAPALQKVKGPDPPPGLPGLRRLHYLRMELINIEQNFSALATFSRILNTTWSI